MFCFYRSPASCFLRPQLRFDVFVGELVPNEHARSTLVLHRNSTESMRRRPRDTPSYPLLWKEQSLVTQLIKCAVPTDAMQTMILNAKPENLILYQHYHTRNRDGYPSDMVLEQGSSNDGANPSTAYDPASWANGLSQKDQYEWFSNCYQMRCDDDCAWGGGYLHLPYNPDTTLKSIASDFLFFCTLALRAKAVPAGRDWKAFSRSTTGFIVSAFEKIRFKGSMGQ